MSMLSIVSILPKVSEVAYAFFTNSSSKAIMQLKLHKTEVRIMLRKLPQKQNFRNMDLNRRKASFELDSLR